MESAIKESEPIECFSNVGIVSKRLRLEASISQNEVYQQLGIPASSYSDMEAGRSTIYHERICDLVDFWKGSFPYVTERYFIKGTDADNKIRLEKQNEFHANYKKILFDATMIKLESEKQMDLFMVMTKEKEKIIEKLELEIENLKKEF